MSDFDFQLLDPKLAAVWLPMYEQFRQDVGSNQLPDENGAMSGFHERTQNRAPAL